jgi:hypothetical protein
MGQQNPGAAGQIPPSGSSNPTAGEAPSDPLAAFADVWKMDPTKAPPADPLAAPLLNSDPTQINAAAAKMNFLSGIPESVMAAAMSGTDPKAFMQVINAAVQKGVAAATQITGGTIEQATRSNNERLISSLPKQFQKIQLESMAPENPVLQHAASQPLLKLVRNQIQQSEPDLTPQQINQRAEQYLLGFANVAAASTPEGIQAARQQQSLKDVNGNTDWDAWVNN